MLLVGFGKIYKEVIVGNIKMVKKIQINMSDRLFYALVVIGVVGLSGVGVYAFGSSDPTVMGHSSAEMEGVCLTDGVNCDVTKEYVDSLMSYSACGWYDGKVCPVENDTSLLLSGYSSTQVKCCGVGAATCEAYDWTTYNTYCSASCGGDVCGWEYGVWRYDQRRELADCEIEYRTTSGATCVSNCGACEFDH